MINFSQIIAEKLANNSEQLKTSYFTKNKYTSTKYFILDNVLPVDSVTELYESLPSSDIYHSFNSFREKKYTFARLDLLKTNLPNLITDAFQSMEVINEIQKITEIDGLEADYTLYAGGISRMDKGHFLNPHIDNSHDAKRKKYRRLNTLFYITPNLNEADGGNFELWDSKVKTPYKIPSLFNRLVVMETNKTSWHSVDPVMSEVRRCCVSNYYFSEHSSSGENYYHVTSFLGRPGQPFRRVYGRIDNALRNVVAKTLKTSRGRELGRR
tara:strand:- start:320 stop:1126 length:807 start_codon:yes stop_codon:yes gene_type:complete